MTKKKVPNRELRRQKEKELRKQLEATQAALKLARQPKPLAPLTNKPWHFHLWKVPKALWVFFGVVGAVLTVLCGLFFLGSLLNPSISIEPNPATSTDKIFDTKFILENNSPCTVSNVKYKIYCWDGDWPQGEDLPVFVDFDLSGPVTLCPSVPYGIRIQFRPFGSPSDAVSILPSINRPFYDIWVSYSAWGRTKEIGRRFWAYKGKDGTYIWNDAGLAHHLKPTDTWPRLSPQ